jgi:phosphopantothenoylcysteine decarboxylase/phosphopantothenate--cysteine ligase
MQETLPLIEGKRILLGVTGSIACYKAVDLASKLTQAGARVDVIMTDAAQRFVTPLTFQAVTGRTVYTDLWRTEMGGSLPTHVAHVGLAEGADLLAIVPATADSLARLAQGRADDLLGVTALAARCPLLFAPAMDGSMYAHPAVQANVATLKSRGATVVEPEYGRFASGFEGQGRLPETPTLLGAIRMVLGRSGVLAGKTVLVTAGGTREPLDPVRYLTNRSSGRQGYALAQAAVDAGASVILVSSAKGLPVPYGVTLIAVETARAMKDAVLAKIDQIDALLMAAAVADFRPSTIAQNKIKKTELLTDAPSIELERTDDILASVKAVRVAGSSPRVVVGFAAESQDLLTYARDKMERKGVDLLVANDISAHDAGFDVETNRVLLLSPDGTQEALPLMSKARVADEIIRRVAGLLMV